MDVIVGDLNQTEFDRLWNDGIKAHEECKLMFPDLGETKRIIQKGGKQAEKRSAVKANAKWTPEADRLLGTDSDQAIARLLGRTVISVRIRRLKLGKRNTIRNSNWTPEMDLLLNANTDEEVAAIIGRTPGAVKRRRMVILAKSGYVRKFNWTPELDALLGKDTDINVSKRLQLSLSAIQKRRTKIGKPPCRKKGGSSS